MPKYLKILPDPDATVCHCGDRNPDCDHWESCDGCGMDYRKHEGHDCIDGVPVQDLRPLANDLRDALAACETERDRLRAELDAAHDGEDALRSEVAKLRAQLAALQAEVSRLREIELSEECYGFITAHGGDGSVLVCGEFKSGREFRQKYRALQSVPQGVEVPELTADVVEELHQKSKGHRNPGYALAFEMYRWVKAHARLVPTPPQPTNNETRG